MLRLGTSFNGLLFIVPFTSENITMKFFSCKHETYVKTRQNLLLSISQIVYDTVSTEADISYEVIG
jgi:hypothetical protein